MKEIKEREREGEIGEKLEKSTLECVGVCLK